ncbi:MAG: AAA family ATPase, partial [Spirochaetales bacterium]|nr:AAA family ATPase [Spirochaetales bacterium]
MRVLQIRLKNLNSLTGEWLIDLSVPAYASNGLFAITGPTGAGKTTILDALTLALYGETPRLGKLSQGENEIFARQTGECFAEVTFETQLGRFCCHWSQRRARGRPDGELQAPKHEISDLDSKKVLSNKVKETRENVEKIVGMDFSRFTRSVLLAQGGFAAFLNAPPADRAPILEEITGTEIYSRISVAVHERLAREKARLDVLNGEAGQIQLLSTDEETRLHTELAELQLRAEELEKLSAEQTAAAEWLRTLDRLDREIESFKAQSQELQARIAAFAENNQRRLRSQKAQEMTPAWVNFDSRRQEQQAQRVQLEALQQKLPGLTLKAESLAQKVKELSEQNLALKNQKELLLPIFRQVNELDVRIQGLRNFWSELQKDLAEQTRETARQSLQRETAAFDLEKCQQELLLVQDTQSSSDALLVDAFGALKTRLENLSRILEGRKAQEERLKSARERLEETLRKAQELQLLHQKHKDAAEQLQQRLNDLQKERLEALAGQTVLELRERSAYLHERKNLLEKLQAGVKESAVFSGPLEGEALQNSKNKIKDIDASLESQIQVLVSLESQEEVLVGELDRNKTVKSYEEARHQLLEGQPCPLCGSLDHPWVNQAPAEVALTELQKVRALKKTQQDAVQSLQNQKMAQTQILTQLQTRREEAQRRQNELQSLIAGTLAELGVSEPLSQALLNRLVEEQGIESQKILALQARLDRLDSEERLARKDLEEKTIIAENGKTSAQRAASDAQLAEQIVEQAEREEQALGEQFESLHRQLCRELAPLGIEEVEITEGLRLVRKLETRRQAWLNNQSRRLELEKSQALLKQKIQEITQQEALTQERIGRLSERSLSQKQELDHLQRQRQELFADKDPADEERRLLEALESSDQALQSALAEERSAAHEIQETQNQREILGEALRKRALQVEEAERDFQRQMAAAGFSSEQEYLSA